MNLEQCIVREIEKHNSLSFARFMELALYAPEIGFYEQKERVGRGGDFYTSVSVGPLFGELLAFQFTEWLAGDCLGEVPQVLETGAHDGKLAYDLLSELRRLSPELFKKVRYYIFEPSRLHEAWQRESLQEFANVRWVHDWTEIDTFSGVMFSNELLDAIPFHRLQWDARFRKWNELRVGWNGQQFIWITEPVASDLTDLPFVSPELSEVLPDGFQTELCPAAVEWWRTASNKLRNGKLMAIDYGLEEEEFFKPERSRGTARSYSRHRLVDNLLDNPGQQDITCHVNFTPLIVAGESQGLATQFFGSQARFLTGVLEKKLRQGIQTWDPKFAAQFQTLTHPAHLGTKFKVLVQTRLG